MTFPRQPKRSGSPQKTRAPSPADWRPTAQAETLKLRAELLRRTRDYFAEQNVMEVETPILSAATVTDVHLASLRTRVAGHGTYFLQTSPEYAMKRLLAAGSGDIYQIAHVFRDAERGRWHNPEFTMVEWYRLGFSAPDLMQDVERLLTVLLAKRTLGQTQFLTYREAVRQYAGVDALTATSPELLDALQTHGVPLPSEQPDDYIEDKDGWLDLLMAAVVGPKLGAHGLTFIHDYPASQAALARLKPGDPAVAERFEVYLDGVELANGFHELTDSREQRKRFEMDLQTRRERGMEQLPVDERLLAALESGLPECSGVALGFDRVAMLAADARQIDAVLSFPIDRA